MMSSTKIELEDFFENALKNNIISEDRAKLLNSIANKITEEYHKNKTVNLNFICTHNSRRSQLAQVWAYYAIAYYQLENIFSFSGGTETTAFFRNTVLTLKEVGFKFEVIDFCHTNPKYNISFKNSSSSILGFSKLYNDEINKNPFIAITTCNNADENCPFIPEAIHRFHLPFVDPKHSDNKENTMDVYLETSKQIASEVNFIFNCVSKNLTL